MMPRDWNGHVLGAMLGGAVGDAIGLPREGLSPRRALRLLGPPPLRHAMFFGRGMFSDDTEHACITAQALLECQGHVGDFGNALAWRLRWWLAGLPAGAGLATARAIIRLWMGFGPERSGVHSAGNGPAMRAAVLGVYYRDHLDYLAQVVRISTRITHTDPRAEHGALAVALAASYASIRGADMDPVEFIRLLKERLGDVEMVCLASKALEHCMSGDEPEAFARAMGLDRGVSGFVNHTVPAALFCWMRHPRDFRSAVEQAVLLGGDTDTVAAIAGSLSGAALGPGAIPREWLNGIIDAPRSVAWIRMLAARLAKASLNPQDRRRMAPMPLFWPAVPLRNLFFLLLVLLHGLRRLLPPY